MLKWRPDLSLPLRQSTLRLKKTTLASVCGVALPLLIQGDGVIHNAETNTRQLINYKEIDMEVWKPDDEEDLHTLSKRDIKVWKYFGWTALYSIALFLVLELFA
jgi:hypothetical protein